MERKLIISAAVLCFSTVANAAEIDGNLIFEGCSIGSSFTEGLIIGFSEQRSRDRYIVLKQIDRMLLNASADFDPAFEQEFLSQKSCLPKAVVRDQVRDVMCVYLRDHPERRHLSAVDLYEEAMSWGWPCPAAPSAR